MMLNNLADFDRSLISTSFGRNNLQRTKSMKVLLTGLRTAINNRFNSSLQLPEGMFYGNTYLLFSEL